MASACGPGPGSRLQRCHPAGTSISSCSVPSSPMANRPGSADARTVITGSLVGTVAMASARSAELERPSATDFEIDPSIRLPQAFLDIRLRRPFYAGLPAYLRLHADLERDQGCV